MGICASSEQLEHVHETDESIVYVKDEQGRGDREMKSGARKVASLFSQRGKKGPNQDSVILCQGFGMEDGVFCGVFDGHGRCGQFISKLVRDYLPFMILSHRNALLLAAADDDDVDDAAFSDDAARSSSTDSSGNSSPQPSASASAQMLEEWRQACANAFAAMDGELKLQPNLDCAFSGTTADEPGVMRVWLPGENSPGLAMARSLGDMRLKRHGVISAPEVTSRRVTGADLFMVLATDGVWDVLSNEEVVSIVCATPRKQHASKAVVEAAVQRWRAKFPTSRVDDCSAVCLFLHDHTLGTAAAASAAAAAAARKARRAAAATPPAS
uniref:protein-serine/threonine phosphatase n=1 Tax=Oryza barthii TaxID=65489 RepID=A0A0D3F2M1_9ORYZ